ncbi:MAG: hypothetical protein H6741_11750 [Alphaproteobacteria bacterium]|nr:hypothetical protein [Alphaproteobacteria bacterium]MCB9793385.1 hypothetical protein [Alphaproteobacteria bacterium]
MCPEAREVPIPKLAVIEADAQRVSVRFDAGTRSSESVVSLRGMVEAVSPMHAPLLSWSELRGRLALTLSALYGDTSALHQLLRGSRGAFPLHLVRRDAARSWEEVLEALDRGEELALLLHTVVQDHPEDEELLDLLDVLEGGWQALSGICTLCGLCPMSRMGEEGRLSTLEVEVGSTLCIPELAALERLFRTIKQP